MIWLANMFGIFLRYYSVFHAIYCNDKWVWINWFSFLFLVIYLISNKNCCLITLKGESLNLFQKSFWCDWKCRIFPNLGKPANKLHVYNVFHRKHDFQRKYRRNFILRLDNSFDSASFHRGLANLRSVFLKQSIIYRMKLTIALFARESISNRNSSSAKAYRVSIYVNIYTEWQWRAPKLRQNM